MKSSLVRINIIPAMLTCALIGLSGCRSTSSDPVAAFDALAEAAESGDRDAFLSGLTRDSADAFDGILAVAGPARAKQLRLGGFSERVRAVSAQMPQVEGLAVVLIETTGTPPQRAQVLMRWEDGAWKLDLISTEMLWNRNWELSGGAPRRGAWFDVDPASVLP